MADGARRRARRNSTSAWLCVLDKPGTRGDGRSGREEGWTGMSPLSRGLRAWLSPLVYLSSNWVSRLGVVLVTTGTVFWFYLLPTILRGESQHPYLGILIFL